MQRFGARFRAAIAGEWRQRRALLAVIPLLTLIALAPGMPVWARVLALLAQGAALVALSRGRRVFHERLRWGDRAVRALCDLAPDGQGAGAALVLRLDDAPGMVARLGRLRFWALMALLERRLAKALTRNAALCRLPGQAGFAVALHPCHRLDGAGAESLARGLGRALGGECRIAGRSVQPSLSIGYSLCDRPRGAGEPDALQAATAAAARAVTRGPGTIEADTVRDLMAHRLHRSTSDLLEALETRAITAHFQPQICLRTGRVTGCEALARWNHPSRGLVPPATFLPALEAADLTTSLAMAMLRDALALLLRADAEGVDLPGVSINLAEADLRRNDLPDRIAWELDRHDIAPERLVVEILESVTTDGDSDMPNRTVARLAAMGCKIDLDDYGTGNASIMGIRRFVVDRLKIDRSYVRQLDLDPSQRQMVSAILSMARALDLDVLAEGVETRSELEMLVALGCAHAQGFGIARPMPADAMIGWLQSRSAAAAPSTTGPALVKVQP